MDRTAGALPEIVCAREEDWETVRAVRLAALTDSPQAFRSTTERESAFDDERWRSWARSGRVFLATVGDRAVGMVAGAPEEDRVDVVAMWLDPRWRGGPGASRLLQAVVGWARGAGAEAVGLAVHADNARATAFYVRHGFERVTTRPSSQDPGRDVHRMVLPLGG